MCGVRWSGSRMGEGNDLLVLAPTLVHVVYGSDFYWDYCASCCVLFLLVFDGETNDTGVPGGV